MTADGHQMGPAAASVQPLLEPSARSVRLTRGAARTLAAGGRVGVVWLPSFALVSHYVAPLTHALVFSTGIAALWWAAMRAAFSAGRLTMYALGAYVAAAAGAAVGFSWVTAVNAIVPDLHLPLTALLEMTAIVFVFTAAWESIATRSLAALQRVLIVGVGARGPELVADLRASGSELPFDLIGIVDDELEDSTVAGAPVHGRIQDIDAIIEAQKPDIVVLSSGGEARRAAFARLLDVAGSGFSVIGLPQFYEHAFGRVPAQDLTPEWFMAILHLYRQPYTKVAKRTFDVLFAVFGLVFTAPLWPVVALLIRRTPGPVIFRQMRLGEGGRPFVILKFRTMRSDAEAAGIATWASEDDPRVTGIGRFLRRTRIDELPQLWNVLRGDMSIVGPRPERPEFLEELTDAVPFWTRRHLVKPGVTGWAQVRRGYTASASATEEKLSFDLWYLRHRSLAVDLAIAVKTITTLLTGSGAR